MKLFKLGLLGGLKLLGPAQVEHGESWGADLDLSAAWLAMRSCKVELLRFGKDTGAFMDRYLVGVDGCPVRTVEPGAHPRGRPARAGLTSVGRSDVTDQQQQQVLTLLTKLIEAFLCDVLGELETSKGPIEIDVVTDKVELWSLPFEFLCDRSGWFVLENQDRSILLTRRVRGSLGEPAALAQESRVLFAWRGAVVAEPHREALYSALEPWIGPHDQEMVRDTKPVFTEPRDAALEDITDACQRAVDEKRPYTHIHLLAHGRPIEDVIPALGSFGVGLRDRVVSAENLAEAMGAGRDLGPPPSSRWPCVIR